LVLGLPATSVGDAPLEMMNGLVLTRLNLITKCAKTIKQLNFFFDCTG